MSLTKYNNLKPKLITNLFTEEEYTSLYSQIEKYSNIPEYVRVVDELGYTSTGLFLNNDILSVLNKK
jgi:hypothetical protein